MSHITIPAGPVTVRVFLDGQEVQKGLRFSSLDSAINFFGMYRLREGNGGSFVLAKNSTDLVEAGLQPPFSTVNFYSENGAHIEPAVVFSAAHGLQRRREHECPVRRGWGFLGLCTLPYEFRSGPVPGLRRGFRGRSRWLRHPKTAQEAKANSFAEYDEEATEVGLRIRGRRKRPNLPDVRDEVRRQDQVKSWKQQRSQQWKAK